MKKIFFLLWGIFVFCAAGFPQPQIQFPNMIRPGDSATAKRQGIVLAENISGVYKIIFSGQAPGSSLPVLSKEEQGKSGGKGSFDKVEMLFSGKIYSPDSYLIEPILFENKKPAEMILLEILVLPRNMEQPYTLMLDLSITASTKPIGQALSDDAGVYRAVFNVSLVK